MSDKSFVGMLHLVCPVCGATVDTNILLDKRLKNSLEKDNYQISNELCEECESKREEYIALVEVSNGEHQSVLKPEEADRTGRMLLLRRSVWSHIFDSDCPNFPAVFIDIECYNQLAQMMSSENN